MTVLSMTVVEGNIVYDGHGDETVVECNIVYDGHGNKTVVECSKV